MPLISYTYSIPYLIFLGYLFLLMFWEFHRINKNISTKYVHWAVIVGFLFFFGLRGFVYTDFINYYPYFQSLPTVWSFDNINIYEYIFEVGFEWYSIFIKSICDNYFFWVFINTLIDVIILNIIIKRYCSYYVLSFIFFFIFQGLIIEFNLYRNAKSILLFLLSIKYLQERKFSKYIILNLIGMSFHISSIVYLPLYFFLHKRLSLKLLLTIFIIGNLIFLFQIKYIEPIFQTLGNIFGGRIDQKIDNYFSNEEYNNPYGMTLGFIERILSFSLILYYLQRIYQLKKHTVIFTNIYILYFISFFYFSETHVVTERVSFLFVCSYWILFPNIYLLMRSQNLKYLFVGIVIIYSCLKLIKLNDKITMRYENILFRVERFENKSIEFYRHREEIKKLTQ